MFHLVVFEQVKIQTDREGNAVYLNIRWDRRKRSRDLCVGGQYSTTTSASLLTHNIWLLLEEATGGVADISEKEKITFFLGFFRFHTWSVRRGEMDHTFDCNGIKIIDLGVCFLTRQSDSDEGESQ